MYYRYSWGYIPTYHYRWLPTIYPFQSIYLPPLQQRPQPLNPFNPATFGFESGGGMLNPSGDIPGLISQFMRMFFANQQQPAQLAAQTKTSSWIKSAKTKPDLSNKINPDLPKLHPILLGALFGSLLGAGYLASTRSKKKETNLVADLVYGGLLGGLGGGSAGLALSQALALT